MTPSKPLRWTYNLCRFFVASVISIYGFAKLNEAQFTVLDSELDKPMGAVPGFWLVWYFFGYSPVYGNFIALVQIAAGLMLTFRRTVLIGALVLFGMLGNIVLIDIFYSVPTQGLFAVSLLFVCSSFIVWCHRFELMEFLWTKQNAFLGNTTRSSIGLWIGRFAIVAVPAVFTYFVANYNNRLPTEIDGAWAVISSTGGIDASRIYFERNRRNLCVIRHTDGTVAKHHFTTDPSNDSLQVYDVWMQPDREILSARYWLRNDTLRIEDTQRSVSMLLVKRRVRPSQDERARYNK